MLPGRAVITFAASDVKRITSGRDVHVMEAWAAFRAIHHFAGSDTIVVRSFFGGPNIAALVEELSSFGVKEFILWGYCGGMADNSRIGDVYLARGAIREDGISHHYLDSEDDYISSDWTDSWVSACESEYIRLADIWSTDAIYRETENKIKAYRERGVAGVEMEVASLYSVCRAKGLKCIAILVVSDLFTCGQWVSGFHERSFGEGVKKVSRFITEKVVM